MRFYVVASSRVFWVKVRTGHRTWGVRFSPLIGIALLIVSAQATCHLDYVPSSLNIQAKGPSPEMSARPFRPGATNPAEKCSLLVFRSDSLDYYISGRPGRTPPAQLTGAFTASGEEPLI